MKIISISMVKNEADIIETFIRYHISILDKMVILDNGSTDGTIEIINKLIEEGLPIHLLFDDNPSYDQSSITTNLFYSSLRQFEPDYIIPLDADEFLVANSRKYIRSMLEKKLHKNAVFFLNWITYVPTEKDNLKELNVLKSIVYRRKIQHNYDKKVIIPTDIGKKYKLIIKQGNHDIVVTSKDVIRRINLKTLRLAHIPIRSKAQAYSKYLVGWLASLARDKQVLFDWYYYYNILKEGKKIVRSDIKKLALHYDIPDKRINIDIVRDPIYLSKEQKFNLRYTRKNKINYFKNILSYTENLARKYSVLLKKQKIGIGSEIIKDNSYDDQLILQIIKDYFSIDGWLSIREAVALYKLVESINSDYVTICEIGSWLGKSSFVLAKALDTRKDGVLFCVDPFDASGDSKSEKIYIKAQKKLKGSLLNVFKSNMRKFGLEKKINILQGYSHKIIKNFNRKLDLLFIDGNHDYNSVLRDYKEWSLLVKRGGFIAFHDVGASHTTGPKEVVELNLVRNDEWVDQQLIDELYIVKRK